MAIVLVISAVAMVPFTGAATQSPDTQVNSNPVADAADPANASTNASTNVTPGGQFMGVIGVQQSELDGEIAQRGFGLKIARANSNESKAAVVNETVADLRQKVSDLRERRQQLQAAHQNGSISDAEYRAEIAELAAETETAKRLANATANASGTLPEDVLAEKGINVTAIQTLRSDAANLTGPEVAEIARSIAGPDVGREIAEDHRPDDRGRNKRGDSQTQHKGNASASSGNQTTGNETSTPGGNQTTTGDETTTSGDETTDGSGSNNSGSDAAGSGRDTGGSSQ